MTGYGYKKSYSGSHSDAVQRYITRCRGTACRAPTGVLLYMILIINVEVLKNNSE